MSDITFEWEQDNNIVPQEEVKAMFGTSFTVYVPEIDRRVLASWEEPENCLFRIIPRYRNLNTFLTDIKKLEAVGYKIDEIYGFPWGEESFSRMAQETKNESRLHVECDYLDSDDIYKSGDLQDTDVYNKTLKQHLQEVQEVEAAPEGHWLRDSITDGAYYDELITVPRQHIVKLWATRQPLDESQRPYIFED